MKTFNPTSSRPARSVQAWQILIGKAMNRQTTTYEALSVQMFDKPAQGVLAEILGNVAFWCKQNDLPVLTAIVVGKDRGTPGDGLPSGGENIDEMREDVYTTDWFDIYPPSETDFRAARLAA